MSGTNELPSWVYPARPMTMENIMEWSAEGLTEEELFYIDEEVVPRILGKLANQIAECERKKILKKDGGSVQSHRPAARAAGSDAELKQTVLRSDESRDPRRTDENLADTLA